MMAKVGDVYNKNGASVKKNEQLAANLASLETKDTHLMNKVTSLTSKNSALENMLSGLRTQMSQLKSQVRLQFNSFLRSM